MPVKTPTGAQRAKATNQLLANLAMELGVAGTQVLIEEYQWSETEAQSWFDKMLTRAQANRATSARTVTDGLKRRANQ